MAGLQGVPPWPGLPAGCRRSTSRASPAPNLLSVLSPPRAPQVERYKALLLKQRDIMIALTQRLNERDEQILGLQAELEAYDAAQKWVLAGRGRPLACAVLFAAWQLWLVLPSRRRMPSTRGTPATALAPSTPLSTSSCPPPYPLFPDPAQEAGGPAGPEDGGADPPAQGRI